MDAGKLSPGVLIAAIAGLLLLAVMFLFDWFGSSGSSVELPPQFLGLPDVGFNAWQSFSVIDVLLGVAALVAIGGGLIARASRGVNSPVVPEAVTCAIGILAALLIVFRIIDPPGDLNREPGVYLGLIAALGIAYGGRRAMVERGTSFSDQASRL